MCANQLFMLSVRLLLHSRLIVMKCLQSQKLYVNFQLHGGQRPNPHVVQG